MQKIRSHPILLLLAINLLVGFLTFRHYGYSWDEPLFYDYAQSIRYAYSPSEWLSGHFDLQQAFGASASDHANRGPAYLLMAQPLAAALTQVGSDPASAWHLTNFIFFQLGVYLLYRLAKRYTDSAPALFAAALMSSQPLLWGHAFINPKDIPFLVFFLGAMVFGFEMIHAAAEKKASPAWRLLLAAFFLGAASGMRVLGPLAGLLVALVAFSHLPWRQALRLLLPYAALAVLVTLLSWPYLWSNPVSQFLAALGFMSDNPTKLQVLFGGQSYAADALPRRYLPTLLALTLTEPVLPMAGLGAILLTRRSLPRRAELAALALWFSLPLLYVITRQPPMYDGYRHFLFMLPPLFIAAGIGFARLSQALPAQAPRLLLALALLTPGILAGARLHPFQYTYYNAYIGGTSGAFRQYETDYWLTCYKDALENLPTRQAKLFVKREPSIAAYYAPKNIEIHDYRTELAQMQPGDLLLVNSRNNEDRNRSFKDWQTLLEIRRGSAIYCEVKIKP